MKRRFFFKLMAGVFLTPFVSVRDAFRYSTFRYSTREISKAQSANIPLEAPRRVYRPDQVVVTIDGKVVTGNDIKVTEFSNEPDTVGDNIFQEFHSRRLL